MTLRVPPQGGGVGGKARMRWSFKVGGCNKGKDGTSMIHDVSTRRMMISLRQAPWSAVA